MELPTGRQDHFARIDDLSAAIHKLHHRKPRLLRPEAEDGHPCQQEAPLPGTARLRLVRAAPTEHVILDAAGAPLSFADVARLLKTDRTERQLRLKITPGSSKKVANRGKSIRTLRVNFSQPAPPRRRSSYATHG